MSATSALRVFAHATMPQSLHAPPELMSGFRLNVRASGAGLGRSACAVARDARSFVVKSPLATPEATTARALPSFAIHCSNICLRVEMLRRRKIAHQYRTSPCG